jgi:hypothetical protein
MPVYLLTLECSSAPVGSGDLHPEAVRVDYGKVIAGVTLHVADGGVSDGGPKAVRVEIIDTDAEVINASRVIGALQDDQTGARQVEPVVIRALDAPRSRKSE